MEMKIALLAIILSGCAVGNELHVNITADDPALAEVGAKALSAWSPLGFIADPDGMPVHLVIVPNLTTHDVYMNKLLGHTDMASGLVELDASLSGDALQHTITHELGHAIARVGHLPCSQHGVMDDGSCRFGWTMELSEDDFAMLCSEAGLCR